MAEEALVDRQRDVGAGHLTRPRFATELPGHLAHLGNGLCGDGLAERSEPAAGIDRDAPTDGGLAGSEQQLGLALLGDADVFVPVELESGRKVVDLGELQVVGPDACFFVRDLRDGHLELVVGLGGNRSRIGGHVRQVEHGVGEGRRGK